MNQIIQKATNWLNDTFDKNTRQKVKELLNKKDKELEESFYKDLTFGTGGMRGISGVGTNRINKYTLGKATQGLSNYILNHSKNKKVAIAYDCRHDSKTLAKTVADIFTANGIKVYLFEDLRPTPELSFAVRTLNCQAGIVLTASHNPPEYNGYKVYWEDGAQIVSPQDNEIINEVNKVDFSEIKFNGDNNLIEYIGKEIDEQFLEASIANGSFNTSNTEDLKIVFTPLHGTSIKAIPQVLEQAGYTQLYIVEEQSEPDGDFPTVKSPNPEEKEALQMAVDLANEIDADIVIGTDPDGDRIGIAVRDNNNELVLLNGNQTMAVMIDFLIKQWKEQGKLNGKQFVATTIVSSPLIEKIASNYGIETKLGLTGFKWIAKMIRDYNELDFIAGGEESFGFMVGDFVRDKDSVTSALLACEIATKAKYNGSSIYNELEKIYEKYGLYTEHLISLVKKGIEGSSEINKIMESFRTSPLKEIDGEKVIFVYDYKTGIKTNVLDSTTTKINLPNSNVLTFETEQGSLVACRPSGTEPKIKFYININSKTQTKEEQQDKIKRITDELFNV